MVRHLIYIKMIPLFNKTQNAETHYISVQYTNSQIDIWHFQHKKLHLSIRLKTFLSPAEITESGWFCDFLKCVYVFFFPPACFCSCKTCSSPIQPYCSSCRMGQCSGNALDLQHALMKLIYRNFKAGCCI